jgi:hypothetical protein
LAHPEVLNSDGLSANRGCVVTLKSQYGVGKSWRLMGTNVSTYKSGSSLEQDVSQGGAAVVFQGVAASPLRQTAEEQPFQPGAAITAA